MKSARNKQNTNSTSGGRGGGRKKPIPIFTYIKEQQEKKQKLDTLVDEGRWESMQSSSITSNILPYRKI